jgi:hypothetical protein
MDIGGFSPLSNINGLSAHLWCHLDFAFTRSDQLILAAPRSPKDGLEGWP